MPRVPKQNNTIPSENKDILVSQVRRRMEETLMEKMTDKEKQYRELFSVMSTYEICRVRDAYKILEAYPTFDHQEELKWTQEEIAKRDVTIK